MKKFSILKDSVYGRPLNCMQNIDKLFRPRISAFYRNMEIWKLMETNKVNIDAYIDKKLDCIVVLHLYVWK